MEKVDKEFASTLEFQILLLEFIRKSLNTLIKKMLNGSAFS